MGYVTLKLLKLFTFTSNTEGAAPPLSSIAVTLVKTCIQAACVDSDNFGDC